MIFAIILALIAIAFIIRKTVYNKNYFTRQNRHHQLLDNESWPNYNTYDVNNMEVMEDNNNSNNSSINASMMLDRPQRIMNRRFSNFDNITNVSTSNTGLLIDENDDEFSYSSGIKQQEHEEHVSDDDNSSLNMSVDITLPPKIVNWEECMR
ncbi:hypothetical protein C1646_714462 [Rhizophagus diaphanus]|nr:hypothetical protein C1646_714462 [Rhizophagus diaphanus] [Rhizophagus sp. MUCL 43196]